MVLMPKNKFVRRETSEIIVRNLGLVINIPFIFMLFYAVRVFSFSFLLIPASFYTYFIVFYTVYVCLVFSCFSSESITSEISSIW